MDVRCERCRAHYVFDDEVFDGEQFKLAGLTVQCTNCGHVFRVKKKELVVTVPVRPEDVTEPPMLATDAARKPAGGAPTPPPVPAPEPGWLVRQAGGVEAPFTELGTLHTWIVERRVGRDDQVSHGDGHWVRLGDLPELASFFEVVDRAGRAPPAPSAPPRGGTALYPPPPDPFPRPPAPAPGAPPRRAPPQATQELSPEEVAAVKGPRRGATSAVGALLLVAVCAVGYVFLPDLGRSPAPAPVVEPQSATPAPPVAPAPPPLAEEPRPAAEVPSGPVAAAPPPAPEPTAEAAPPRPLEPSAEAAPPAKVKPTEPPPPPKPAPDGPRQWLAQARRLREQGAPSRAVELFARVITADSENVEALTGRGLCYLELGQYHAAQASFQTALAVDPEAADALMGLAETYRSQGQKSDALAAYERYLKLHPDGDEAAVARNAISQLKE